MAPVVDGLFLPQKPVDLREAGSFLRGPIITGINQDDGSFYTMIREFWQRFSFTRRCTSVFARVREYVRVM